MTVRMRHTRAHTGNRRSHHALSEPAVSVDSKDGAHLRHRVSPITGKYKGAQVLDLSKKNSKVSRKQQLRAEKLKKAEAKKAEKKVKKEVKKDKVVKAEKVTEAK